MQHPKPFDGQRHELFSMLAVAASHDMGMALIPQMLIESELQKELVIVSNKTKRQPEVLSHSFEPRHLTDYSKIC